MSSPRRLARRYAVLALYQWQLTGKPPQEIASDFLDDPEWLEEVAAGLRGEADEAVEDAAARRDRRFDLGLFDRLLKGVPRELDAIDAQLQAAIDRPLAQVDPVERAILRLGAFEILFCPEVPYQVAINEAIDLAKLLGAEQGHRYVNGVLDRLARARPPANPRTATTPPR
ncbi:transcription antitermination factor NusB [Thiococcus pfennigii]|jgi:N utilization substance protein B|uniref:transcription antitermination factor NusB n=1 Tax=Thiococcus pfennigii TaxID=1057 RepID=UPI0019039EE6|nr:transcription antitermination factor NusB [Thiococcus pfennigii]MBK1699496.1 transcription antitermination factor NusB [Thiococcus pfennigii]MBK1730722.1 transcription antitermination factor NusB [Thiococcus pfennigii]